MDGPSPHLLAQLEELPKRLCRAEVLRLLAQRELKLEHAAWILSLSVRQIQRLKKRRKTGGEGWDEHGNRNRPPVNATDPDQKAMIVRLARTCYAGLNDTRLHLELQEKHGITVSRQTVRRILRSAGIVPMVAKVRRAKVPEVEFKRPARPKDFVPTSGQAGPNQLGD